MQQTADFWDNVAEKYAKSPINDMDAYNYTLGRTRTYLSAKDKVLELGCGTGSTALTLATSVDEIIATDISKNMISIAKSKAKDQGATNVTFATATVADAGEDEGPFDAVLAHNLLHLLENLPAALERIHSQLKPGGVFISKTVCRPGRDAPMKYRLMRIIVPVMQMLGKAPYVNFMHVGELERMIARQGFKILETGNHPPPSRYIVARKI